MDLKTMSDKVCTNCGTATTAKWYSGPTCRNCYNKLRKINNPELVDRLAKIAKKTREKNQDKIKIKQHEYYIENRDYL